MHLTQAAAFSLCHQGPILVDYSRCSVNSKHNQTLRSVSLWSAIESISCRVLWWQSPITLCVQVFTALELFHFIITLKHPPPIESQPAAVQRTVSSVHRGGQGSFQAAVNSSFCLGKRFMSIQTTGAVSFLTTSVKRGQSNTQLPLSCVCHNYSEGQPFPRSD